MRVRAYSRSPISRQNRPFRRQFALASEPYLWVRFKTQNELSLEMDHFWHQKRDLEQALRKIKRLWTMLLASLLWVPVPVAAQSSSSSNYKVDQTIFSTGSEQDLQSGQYKAQATLGDLGVGNTSSLNYQAYAGFNTTDEPYLEFVVTGNNVDLDYLDVGQTKTANGNFYIRAWQANGYVVTTESDPPTNLTFPAEQIDPMVTPAASSVGTEQFGMNLVANTAPATFGAVPQQVPDNTFSFGVAATGYDVANSFKYIKGDIVAQSPKSTSVTIYTLSYIFNIDDDTTSGQYNFNHVLVATATY